MDDLIAALPMYDLPERRAETDAQWVRLRDALRAEGIAAPERLVRRNADMPSVPGGIRDASGEVIAPDPASLPPDELDLATLWRHPELLFAQACWGPMGQGLEAHVAVVGQPDYSDFEGGAGELYSSVVLMRSIPPSGLPATSSSRGENKGGDVPAPAGGGASLPVEAMRGRRLAYNGPDSMSGILALGCDLEAIGESLDIFSERIETGGHRASAVAVAEGRADVCALDCRTWAYLRELEPRAAEVSVAGWTAQRKGLPYVSAAGLGYLHDPVRRAILRVEAQPPMSRASSG